MANKTAAELENEAAIAKRREAADASPHTWIPVEVGDSIMGKVVDIDMAWSDVQDGFYPLIRIQWIDVTPDVANRPREELVWHVMGAVAQNEVMKAQPEIGETINVTFDGVSTKEPARKGYSRPALYTVRVQNRDPKEVSKRAYEALRANGVGRPQRRAGSELGPRPAPFEPAPEQSLSDRFGDDLPE